MEEARTVLERLERIERLRAEGAPPAALRLELRSLLAEGEAWLAVEPTGTERARKLLADCRARANAARPGTTLLPLEAVRSSPERT
ncbi:MAG: hypothetical protein ICV74_01345 [Thermoleophilia bacterium]|nr:hypothetical protein [Thermoleophilia bacterium]